MFSVKSLIKLIVFGLVLLYKGAICSVTWSYFHAGSPSTEGRLKSMAISSLSYCAVECFVHTQCEIFAHDSARNVCFLHDGSFSSTDGFSSSTLRYYKAACAGTSTYSYIKSIKKCMRYVTERMEWEDARAVCKDSGGHLVFVKTQAVLDYLEDQRESDGTKYWVGGTQVEEGSNFFKWLSGEIIDSTNGGQLWKYGSPNVNGRTQKLCVATRHSSTKNEFGLVERSCNETRKFFCEI